MSSYQLLILLFVALIAFAVGALVFYRLGCRRGCADAEPARITLVRDIAALQARLDEAKVGAEVLVSSLNASRRSEASACMELAQVTVRLEEQVRSSHEKLVVWQQAEQRLRESFQNLATQILDERAAKFSEQSQQQLGGILDPLKLQLKEFRESVAQTYANEQRERGMLSQEIQTLKQLNQQISEDAINLTRALKGDNQVQGAWGEMVLERVLEASGLQSGREYEVQTSYSDEDGGRPRPDVVVHLPDDKDLVIDAKVSLLAYERYVAIEDGALRATALREHIASLKRHIDGLSARGYSDLPGMRTLDFVLMFVPIESAFIEAVRAESGLYAYAMSKNISLVSPSTLLATLRTVAHLWKIERRNINAMEIAKRAALLHDNFAQMAGELINVGILLDKAKSSQTNALRRLTEGGKGSVILQVQNLAEMGAPAKKTLPANLLTQAGGTEEIPVLDAENDNGAE